jgi:hypothetical protein
MERVAECHCGQLRAVTSGEPDSVYLCHCKACQRRTGAVIHNGSRWLKTQVQIEGEHKVYGRIADSGFEIRFHFCPNCGSSVFWEGDRSPTTCGIAVGCFADPDFPTADLVRLGRVDASLARVAAKYRAFPASSLLRRKVE